MGADESKQNRKPETRELTTDEINRILLKQRLEYEQKCREYDLAAKAHIRNSPQQQPQRSTPSSAQLSGNHRVTPPVRATAPPPRTKEPAPHHTSDSPSYSSLERDRTPYSYTQNDLVTEGRSVNNVYPSLDDLAIANKGDSQRPQPSAPARDRSGSRSRPQRGGNIVKDNHACPTCKASFGITIYNCPGGHSSCGDCKARSSPCGICGLHITDMRNRALEDYMAETKSPCPNAEDGCCLLIKLADLEFHLKECPFNELNCPLAAINKNCLWRGKISQVSDHVSEAHPQNCTINVDTEAILPNICFDEHVVHFVTIGPFKFLVTLKVSSLDRMIYVLAQLMGTQVSAAKWIYELHVYNKREPRRKYQYVDVCRSASVPIDNIIRDASCGAMPLQHALTYINEGALTYKFYIKKAFEDNKEFWNKNHRGRGARRRY